eukprot:gnl/TRDRNA2_/TRDRNA2_172859_c13_seq2.p1 gnl/TRDRNA2_/TRDRNA2_172859_c13~~gnl/TRDRNA2_/TRDRNA2_172859_c13_seq2.p1  ORF type:complete len:363 (-),score=62.66 gnl/TRDRNA2_/TRDRNA2_172859_c13_seq2:1485-2573(-)
MVQLFAHKDDEGSCAAPLEQTMQTAISLNCLQSALEQTVEAAVDKLLQQEVRPLQQLMQTQHGVLMDELSMLKLLLLQRGNGVDLTSAREHTMQPRPPRSETDVASIITADLESLKEDATIPEPLGAPPVLAHFGQSSDGILQVEEAKDASLSTPLDLKCINVETGLIDQDELPACKADGPMGQMGKDHKSPQPSKPERSLWPSCRTTDSLMSSRELPPKAKTKSDHELTIMKEDVDFQDDISCWQIRLLELREWLSGFEEPERTGCLAALVTSAKFDTMTMCVILLNAAFMAYEANYDISHLEQGPTSFAKSASLFFVAFFRRRIDHEVVRASRILLYQQSGEVEQPRFFSSSLWLSTSRS